MIKKALFAVASKLVLQPLFRQTRGMTLGVRVAVIDGEDRVMLVRHSYAPGYLMPGGGVERGETLREAAKREILEEAGIAATGEPLLHGIFSNHVQFPGDHVACYVLRAFERRAWKPGLEIVEARFFPIAALPKGTTGGTRRRIAEIVEGKPPEGIW